MSTYFLATPLGKAKQSKIQSKIDMGSKGDDVGEKGDKTRVPHDANINHLETVEELPESAFAPYVGFGVLMTSKLGTNVILMRYVAAITQYVLSKGFIFFF